MQQGSKQLVSNKHTQLAQTKSFVGSGAKIKVQKKNTNKHTTHPFFFSFLLLWLVVVVVEMCAGWRRGVHQLTMSSDDGWSDTLSPGRRRREQLGGASERSNSERTLRSSGNALSASDSQTSAASRLAAATVASDATDDAGATAQRERAWLDLLRDARVPAAHLAVLRDDDGLRTRGARAALVRWPRTRAARSSASSAADSSTAFVTTTTSATAGLGSAAPQSSRSGVRSSARAADATSSVQTALTSASASAGVEVRLV